MTYNLEAIRNLLDDSFDSGEIITLAFDRFKSVHDDFGLGITKNQMIVAIIDHANRYGRVDSIIDYVKTENPFQFERYADQLEMVAPDQVNRPTFGTGRRLQDIQRNIDHDYQLLLEYEDQLAYEDDPRRLMKIRHEIARQKASIAGYRQEAKELQQTAPQTGSAASDEALQRLQDIDQKLDALNDQVSRAEDRLAAGQQTIRDDIAQQQEAVLAHIESQHRQTVAVLVKKMDANQLKLVELLLDAADQQQIARWEGQQLTLLAQEALVDLKRLRQNQPDTAQWQSMLDLLARETGWEQKLKLTFPLIPGILEFESEMTMDVVPALKDVWERMANKIKRQK